MSSPSNVPPTTGQPVVALGDEPADRPPMKRSFDQVDEIPKYVGDRPKVLLFDGGAVLHNRFTLAHCFHEVFTKVFPEHPVPSQDDIAEALSYSTIWPDILSHLGIPRDMYKARRKVSEDTYLQSYVDFDGFNKVVFFTDCLRVLRAAKEKGFIMVLRTISTVKAAQVLCDAGATDIFDIYLDDENAWISRGPDAPPRPIESTELKVAYDEFLKGKGVRVEDDNHIALKPEEVLLVCGCVGILMRHTKKGAANELWGCKLCYIARTEAELPVELEAQLDLEVEDLDEFGYSLFDLPLPETAPARTMAANGATALTDSLTLEEVIEIPDEEENEVEVAAEEEATV